MMASRVSGRPTVAVEVKMRMSVARASSRPPPRAREETADIVGTGRIERVFNVERRVLRNARTLVHMKRLATESVE